MKHESKMRPSQCVRRGVAWLSAIRPRWYREINLERLDLATCDDCVLGQLFGDYNDAEQIFGSDATQLGALGMNIDYRFDQPHADETQEFNRLTALWKRAIRRLRTSNAR